MTETTPATHAEITLTINGNRVTVPSHTTVAAAIARAGGTGFRTSVKHEPRVPLCGMGICFECRVTIDGRANLRSCSIYCQEGMEVRTDG
jgi:D-hydroxyproline dehydrogenase subunit gamma